MAAQLVGLPVDRCGSRMRARHDVAAAVIPRHHDFNHEDTKSTKDHGELFVFFGGARQRRPYVLATGDADGGASPLVLF